MLMLVGNNLGSAAWTIALQRLSLRIGRRLEPAVAACASAPHALLTGVGRVSTILLVTSCGVSLLVVARPSLSATGARQRLVRDPSTTRPAGGALPAAGPAPHPPDLPAALLAHELDSRSLEERAQRLRPQAAPRQVGLARERQHFHLGRRDPAELQPSSSRAPAEIALLDLSQARTLTPAGSAALGGLLSDRIGYRHTFLVTAALQAVGVLLYTPLASLVAAEAAPPKRARASTAAEPRACGAGSSFSAPPRQPARAAPLAAPLLRADGTTRSMGDHAPE